jgi:hypothetical protein
MARIRSIKPEFFASEDVSALPFRARLTWVGLWTHADDHGRCKDVLGLLKAAIWPLDDSVTLDNIAEDLDELAKHHRIVRYEVAGKAYIAIVNWHVHQAINRPKRSDIPRPTVLVGPSDPDVRGFCHDCAVQAHATVTDDAVTTHGAVTSGREGEGKGMEGERAPSNHASRPPAKPIDPEPPLRCPEHTSVKRPPRCGACGDARRDHDAWQRRIRDAPTHVPGAPDCDRHPGQPSGRCRSCESDAVPPPDLRSVLRGAL